jgi:hypothetical protein
MEDGKPRSVCTTSFVSNEAVLKRSHDAELEAIGDHEYEECAALGRTYAATFSELRRWWIFVLQNGCNETTVRAGSGGGGNRTLCRCPVKT